MDRFFVSRKQVADLQAGRNNIAVARTAMETIVSVANGRQIVLPEMRGGFLPNVLRDAGAVVLPKIEFEEAAGAARAEREAAAERRRRRSSPFKSQLSALRRGLFYFKNVEYFLDIPFIVLQNT